MDYEEASSSRSLQWTISSSLWLTARALQDEAQAAEAAPKGEQVKKGYVGIHSTGFKDFLLKPELMRAIVDCGFEHPSEGDLLDWRSAKAVRALTSGVC